MRRARTLLLIGIWITILPYLGFPYSWKNVLFTLSGLGLVYFSYIFYRELKANSKADGEFDNFRENNDFSDNADQVEIMIDEIVEPEQLNQNEF